MRNIGLQDRLAKVAAAVSRGALPVLASGLQSRILTLLCPVRLLWLDTPRICFQFHLSAHALTA